MPAGFLLAVAIAACGSGTNPGTAGPATGTVELVNFQYSPRNLDIGSGTSLTFVNKDAAAHTVTEGRDGAPSPGGRFDDRVNEGHSVAISFDAPGAYQITCKFHPTMSMTVTVRP
ncbi:MAG: cupredoxin domain-containing protein [Candidatus Limnocylindrales bacterium]